VLAFVEARYGEFVLLRPPLKLHTLALWSAPLLLLVGIAIYLLRRTRVRQANASDGRQHPAALSPAEQQRLQSILAKSDDRKFEQ
jgi:cytochrome c-type biogenesis protein CcmH